MSPGLSRRGILGAGGLLPVLAARRSTMSTPYPRSDLGSRIMTGVSDADYSLNPYLPGTGWDVIFDAAALNIPATQLEIYHIALDGPVGSFATWTRNSKTLGFMAGWTNEWAATVPLAQTDTLAFFWNTAYAAGPYNKTSNIQPTVTLWLRLAQPVIS